MKFIALVLVALTASFVAHAQTQTDSGVEVLKYSWNKERVGWERDPFSGPIENFDEMRVRSRNEKRIQDLKRGGNGAEVNKAERDARIDNVMISAIHQNSWARYGFTYKVAVKNNAAQPITLIDWDYVFYDENTYEELSRRQFTSNEKISPGKSRELKFFIPSPPTKTVSVNSLGKNERVGIGERVIIVRVTYADGSTWENQ